MIGEHSDQNALLVDELTKNGLNPYVIPAAFMEFLSIVSWALTLTVLPHEIDALKAK